jgi:enoyl-[acyl-carrier protein] reductase I
MDLLKGKRILITGVITTSSIAFHVAQACRREGAEVVLTGYGRIRLVERLAQRLDQHTPVIELDVTDEDHLASLPERLSAHVDGLDGVLHAIAYAPGAAMGGNFLTAGWPDVAQALHVSTYSMQSLIRGVRPMLSAGSSVVGLDFDASRAYAGYDWMGVAKAGLESCTRYLASYLGADGIRVNLVAAGPLRTMAARSIGGDQAAAETGRDWAEQAPLGWDDEAFDPVANACVALLSDLFPATTGEIVHVDGGVHAVGDRPGTRAATAVPVPGARS